MTDTPKPKRLEPGEFEQQLFHCWDGDKTSMQAVREHVAALEEEIRFHRHDAIEGHSKANASLSELDFMRPVVEAAERLHYHLFIECRGFDLAGTVHRTVSSITADALRGVLLAASVYQSKGGDADGPEGLHAGRNRENTTVPAEPVEVAVGGVDTNALIRGAVQWFESREPETMSEEDVEFLGIVHRYDLTHDVNDDGTITVRPAEDVKADAAGELTHEWNTVWTSRPGGRLRKICKHCEGDFPPEEMGEPCSARKADHA